MVREDRKGKWDRKAAAAAGEGAKEGGGRNRSEREVVEARWRRSHRLETRGTAEEEEGEGGGGSRRKISTRSSSQSTASICGERINEAYEDNFL